MAITPRYKLSNLQSLLGTGWIDVVIPGLLNAALL